MTKYETPRITTYGTLAELTALDSASGGILIGQTGMSLSAVTPTTPPGGGADFPGGGTDFTPTNQTTPPPGNITTLVGPETLGGSGDVATRVGPASLAGSGDVASPFGMGVDSAASGTSADVIATPVGGETTPAASADGAAGAAGPVSIDGAGLPFTGADVGVVSAVAAALTAAGVTLRRAVTRR